MPPKTVNEHIASPQIKVRTVQQFYVNILQLNVPSRGMRYHRPMCNQATPKTPLIPPPKKKLQAPQSNHASPEKKITSVYTSESYPITYFFCYKERKKSSNRLSPFSGESAGSKRPSTSKVQWQQQQTTCVSAHLHGRSLGKAPIHQKPPLVPCDRRDIVVPVWRGRTNVPLGRRR